MGIRNIFSFLFVCSVILSCSSDKEIINMISVQGKWSKDVVQSFEFNITDAEKAKNIIFVVRNNEEYPYSNIRFFVQFENLKSKKKEIDTLNYILAKPDGTWIGSGFGSTKETLFQYRMNFTFPSNGTYKVGIKQAMRKDNLPGIEDIGLKIVNVNPSK